MWPINFYLIRWEGGVLLGSAWRMRLILWTIENFLMLHVLFNTLPVAISKCHSSWLKRARLASSISFFPSFSGKSFFLPAMFLGKKTWQEDQPYYFEDIQKQEFSQHVGFKMPLILGVVLWICGLDFRQINMRLNVSFCRLLWFIILNPQPVPWNMVDVKVSFLFLHQICLCFVCSCFV